MTFEEWWPLWANLPEHLRGMETVDAARSAWLAALQVEREACAKLVEAAGAYTEWNEEAVDLARQIREGVRRAITPP